MAVYMLKKKKENTFDENKITKLVLSLYFFKGKFQLNLSKYRYGIKREHLGRAGHQQPEFSLAKCYTKIFKDMSVT